MLGLSASLTVSSYFVQDRGPDSVAGTKNQMCIARLFKARIWLAHTQPVFRLMRPAKKSRLQHKENLWGHSRSSLTT